MSTQSGIHLSEFIPTAPFSVLLAGPGSPYRDFYPMRTLDEWLYIKATGYSRYMHHVIDTVHDCGTYRTNIAGYDEDAKSINALNSNYEYTSPSDENDRAIAMTINDPVGLSREVNRASYPYDKKSRRLAVHLIFRTAEVTAESIAAINMRLSELAPEQLDIDNYKP